MTQVPLTPEQRMLRIAGAAFIDSADPAAREAARKLLGMP
jgi:hypothetical protein